jgi:hypothetical protein
MAQAIEKMVWRVSCIAYQWQMFARRDYIILVEYSSEGTVQCLASLCQADSLRADQQNNNS